MCAWTAPRTWAASEVVTAALMNQHVRDNLLYLKSTGATVTIDGPMDIASYVEIGTDNIRALRCSLAAANYHIEGGLMSATTSGTITSFTQGFTAVPAVVVSFVNPSSTLDASYVYVHEATTSGFTAKANTGAGDNLNWIALGPS